MEKEILNESNFAAIDAKFSISEDHGPNATMRLKLAREWQKLDETEKAKVRSIRARRGIKCHVCGMLGYYRENCPNACVSPYGSRDGTEEELEKEEEERRRQKLQKRKNEELCGDPNALGLGLLWGNVGAGETKEEKNIRMRRQRRQLYRQQQKHGNRTGNDEDDDLSSGNEDEEHGFRETLAELRPSMVKERERLKESDKKTQTFDFFAVASEGYSRNLGELTLHQVRLSTTLIIVK
jgi:hypothetical protein